MIRVQKAEFDPGESLNHFTNIHTHAGAIVSFTGLVRGLAGKAKVIRLELEHYAGFTESEMELVEAKAHHKWPGIETLILHRYGALYPSDAIMMVAVASAHRKDAFEAASFLMDYLKTDAPFWKKEVYEGGAQWIEPRATDREARQSWV